MRSNQGQDHVQAGEREEGSVVGADSVSRSSDSLAGAGWRCRKIGKFKSFVPSKSRPFSWLSLAPLWQSRNQILGDLFGDPTNDERRRWMQIQREAGVKFPEDLIVREHPEREEVSFIVLGDTGEGDASQYAVVSPLAVGDKGTHFMVICSDVIYPAGGTDQYEDKFYRPYRDYERPIYALPGNHDWYDGLTGFMFHLCGWDGRRLPGDPEPASWRERLRDLLWRRSPEEDGTAGARRKAWRPLLTQRSGQRTPYFAIETGPLLIVGIDTGISGDIDREQGDWLRKISREVPKPKLLLTGKPLYVDGEYHPGVIEGGGTVDEIVRALENKYVAVVGGDIHNYQRYPVKLEDGRGIEYIVSGGGGAYMSATHQIPYIRLPGVDEKDFRCYPRRGDSLSFYSNLYDRRFGFGKGWFEIPPNEAAAYMAERLLGLEKGGLQRVDQKYLEENIGRMRESDKNAYITRRTRLIAKRIYPPPGRGRDPLHHFFSEFFDWNDPPLFKNFLRLDASRSELRIRCFAATGCLEHEKNPPVEDDIRIKLPPHT